MMLDKINNLRDFITKNSKEILVIQLFLALALVSVLYSLTLPLTTHGDTYVTLLANKASSDLTFPDREILMNFDFKPYFYTNILDFLSNHFSLLTYKFILLFVLVFATLYCAYLALRILGFGISISVLVAIIALLPRVGIGGEAWGVIVADDVLGRTLGLPLLWLISAWFIRRRFDHKSLWPVFVLSGLASYFHPVSLIFFNGLLFIIFFIFIIFDKEYKRDFKDLFLSVVAFSLSASFLLSKILFVTKKMSTAFSGYGAVSARDYYDALVYRVGWDFLPQSAIYTIHFIIINFIFFIAIGYVVYNIYNKKIDKSSIEYFISKFGLIIIFLSVFLSIFIPNTELWLVKSFDFPFAIQQSSRFFKYYYLGQYLILAVFSTQFFKDFKNNKKILFTAFLLIGIASSTFGFEIFKFVVGYKNYKKEYIPNIFQKDKLQNDLVVYPSTCKQLENANINRDELVISDHFQIRYYCGTRLFTTFEEGSIYFITGKRELVNWMRTYEEQKRALYSESPDNLIAFANKVGARYAVVEATSPMISKLENKKMVVSKDDILAVIKFK